MTTLTSAVYCGVDVSKATLDAFLLGHRLRVANTPAGFEQLMAWIRRIHCAAHVACESTGGYEARMVRALRKAGLRAYILNGARVRMYATSLGFLAKTDRIDAEVIARFAGAKPMVQPAVTTPCQDKLKAIASLMGTIKARMVALGNSLDTAVEPVVRTCIQRMLRADQKELQRLEAKVDQLLAKDLETAGKVKKLTAFQGVGKTTAVTLLAYLPELGTISKQRATALAGLAPFAKDTGTKTGKRSIRGGRSGVRTTLYMAALTAIRCNPVLAPFYKRLNLKA